MCPVCATYGRAFQEVFWNGFRRELGRPAPFRKLTLSLRSYVVCCVEPSIPGDSKISYLQTNRYLPDRRPPGPFDHRPQERQVRAQNRIAPLIVPPVAGPTVSYCDSLRAARIDAAISGTRLRISFRRREWCFRVLFATIGR